jgi:phosphatidylglycerol:prolipoprotein diacylglycerol transferase
MLPYIVLHSFPVGPLTIQVWGLFVALGVVFGTMTAASFAKRRGLSKETVWDSALWLVVGGVLGARLFHVFVYNPDYYVWHPLEIPAVWEGGLSMMGGLLGAALSGAWFIKRRKLEWHQYLTTWSFGLPVGIAIGRIGCFLIHDHPGTLTSFVLGVKYPEGVVRHDLGLYESLYGFFLAVIFFFLEWKRPGKTPYSAVLFLTYGLFRLGADFLRVSGTLNADVRYAGLTPSQYIAVLMILFGTWLFYKKLSDKN